MQREIREIVEFLTQHSYPHPLNTKMLMTPTTKDFLNIFKFLYNFLEVKYTPAQKVEEEIPQIFKTLKYPFNISKSSMFTVGSPHTWPHILGALHWLLNSIKYALGVYEQPSLFSAQSSNQQDDEFDAVSDSEVLFYYVKDTYQEFLDGADTFEDREEVLSQRIKERILGETGNIEQLAMEEQRLSAELELMQQEPCRLTALQENVQMMTSDNERFYKYLQELKEHKRIHQQKLQDIELQFQQSELELEQAMSEQQKLEYQLANQELSETDVHRLHSEMRQLNANLDAIDRDKQEVDQQIWDKEKQIAKKQEQLEKQVTHFNSLARGLHLIPPTADNAHGIDYEMKLNFYNLHGNKSSLMDFTSTIKPALIQLKKQVNEEVHKLNSQKLLEEETLEQLTEMVESKQEEVTKLDCKLQRRAKELETLKEKVKEESRLLAEQQSMLEQKLQQMQVVGDTDLARTQAELKELITRHHEQDAELQQEYKDYELFLLHACTKVVEHKAIIDERISELHQQATMMMQHLQDINLPPAVVPT